MPYAVFTVNSNESIMSTDRPNNVIALAPYRFARQVSQHRPRPYVTWYSNVGFAASAPSASASIRPLRTAPDRSRCDSQSVPTVTLAGSS